MKKNIICLILFALLCPIGYCNNETQQEKDKIKTENKTDEKIKEETTGAAVPLEKFEYKPCEGDEKIKGCRIEDLTEQKNNKSNELP